MADQSENLFYLHAHPLTRTDPLVGSEEDDFFLCNVCTGEIPEFRYTCSLCPDFDLCENCFFNQKCNICDAAYSMENDRWKCQMCERFSFCPKCHNDDNISNHENGQHTFEHIDSKVTVDFHVQDYESGDEAEGRVM